MSDTAKALRNAARVDRREDDALSLKREVLAARALCVNAALQQRTMGEQPADTLARAETFWAWVSQAGDNRKAP